MLVSAAWIGPAIFAVLNRLAQGRLNGWDAATPQELIFTGGDWFLYAFITPAAFAVSRRWPLTRPHLARRVWLHLAFALLFCVVWASLGKILGAALSIIFVPNAWHDAMAAGTQFWLHAFRDWVSWILITLPYGVAVYLAMVGVEHAIRYFVEVREKEVHVAQLSSQLADARLAALQAQLNPHFLFNALNTIAVHARDGDGAGTARIVEQLSDVLRRTLGRHRTNEVPLDDELDLVHQYLAIERARFPDRVQERFDIAPDIGSAAVPGFMLQHLVENAVRHGIARRSGPGLVQVTARRDGDTLELAVIDDGVGFDPDAPAPAGHGIENTRDRLRTLYGDRATLTIVRNADRGMTVTVRLPWHEVVADDLHAAE
jgi:two-component system LytT family sensor kinase